MAFSKIFYVNLFIFGLMSFSLYALQLGDQLSLEFMANYSDPTVVLNNEDIDSCVAVYKCTEKAWYLGKMLTYAFFFRPGFEMTESFVVVEG